MRAASGADWPLPRVGVEGGRLVFSDERATADANPVWDALWRGECSGHIDVAGLPGEERGSP